MKKRLLLILLLATSLVVGVGCGGESKSDKAKKQVCSAKSDIQTQVNKLKGLTLSTATTSQVQDSLNSIKTDLQKIADAQPDLTSELKKNVQAANQAFVSQFQSIVGDLGTNLSISNAQTKLQAALQQLASAYQKSFANVSCS